MRESLYSHCVRIGAKWLLEEWDDGSCSPETVSHGSKRRVWWRCKAGHRWQATVADRMSGSGCPYCSGKLVQPGVNDLATTHPQVAAQWLWERNGTLGPSQVSAGSQRKVWWRCRQGHTWQAAIHSRAAGSGCPYCGGKRVLSGENDLGTLFPNLSAEWAEENAPLTPRDVRPHCNKTVWWVCPQGHRWRAKISARVKDQSGCPYCNNRKVLPGFNDLKTKDPELAAQWCQELNGDLTPDRVLPGSKQKVWWICSLGHVWQARIASRAGKTRPGCPVCAGNISRKQKERYERIAAGILPPDGL